jgi:hypothetical protein
MIVSKAAAASASLNDSHFTSFAMTSITGLLA